ncbi:hypothetical protein J6590_076659 [Homalodisca vitripennis]|nr:hypothetical protein J6590_076659 [Homalodisca vitripennis]
MEVTVLSEGQHDTLILRRSTATIAQVYAVSSRNIRRVSTATGAEAGRVAASSVSGLPAQAFAFVSNTSICAEILGRLQATPVFCLRTRASLLRYSGDHEQPQPFDFRYSGDYKQPKSFTFVSGTKICAETFWRLQATPVLYLRVKNNSICAEALSLEITRNLSPSPSCRVPVSVLRHSEDNKKKPRVVMLQLHVISYLDVFPPPEQLQQ